MQTPESSPLTSPSTAQALDATMVDTSAALAQTMAPDAILPSTSPSDTLPAPPSDEAFEAMMKPGAVQSRRGKSAKILRDVDFKKLVRSTILPRSVGCESQAASALVIDEKQRYEVLETLGEGGVGEVTLVKDNDIDRSVAMKRLKGDALDPGSVLRFVDEIRTIGQLEHPNIIPIHDVGVDEQGNYYFIMKRIEGETLEDIIKKLVEGDPTYLRRYPTDVRLQIFLDILQAVQFAHDRGIIHRDIKPANVMIGPYGEVVVMDWGLAKKIEDAYEVSTDPRALGDDALEGSPQQPTRRRLYQTQHGALLGTPAYMSPEQAQGLVDQIDERTDTYALTVLLHELLTLRHYLVDCKSLNQMLLGVISEEVTPGSFFRNLTQGGQPIRAEHAHYLERGLRKGLDARFQSVAEMITELQLVIAGDFAVKCHVTFTKSMAHRFLHSIDRNPRAAFILSLAAMLALVAMVGLSLYALVGMVA